MKQTQSQSQQSRDAIQFQLRLPDALKARIDRAALENGRSINTEIVVALQKAFPDQPPSTKATADLLKYIWEGGNDLERFTRAAMAEGDFRQIGGDFRVTSSEDGFVTITFLAKPDEP